MKMSRDTARNSFRLTAQEATLLEAAVRIALAQADPQISFANAVHLAILANDLHKHGEVKS